MAEVVKFEMSEMIVSEVVIDLIDFDKALFQCKFDY
jgi:hypothetical protein